MLTLAISEGGACETVVARGGSIGDAYFGGCGVCDHRTSTSNSPSTGQRPSTSASSIQPPTVVNRRQHTDSMPYVTIDGVTIDAARLMLLPVEVAQILRVDEKDVRNMIRRGELQDVSSDGRRRLDPDEVIVLVEKRVAEGELSPHVFVELAALIAGRL